MMHVMRKIGLLLLIGLLSGCVQRTLSVTSEPSGALVYLNGQEVGRTPLKRDFTWYGTYDVQLRREGYQTLDTKSKVIAPAWLWFPFDLVAELWPGRIKDQHHLHYTLSPIDPGPVDAPTLVSRGLNYRGDLESSAHTREPSTQSTTQSTTAR